MAFQKLVTLDASTTVSLGGTDKKTNKKNPIEAEGYYLGSRKIPSNLARAGFTYLHVLKTPSGNLGVWGKHDLDKQMLDVPAGTMTKIEYVGKVPVKTGHMLKFDVYIEPENVIVVTPQAADDVPRIKDDAEDFYVEEESDDEVEARRARVQAQLNKRK